MSEIKKTDLVVIGAGPGGYAAAFYAADKGMDVTLVEKNPTLGGVCLNVGCIPSKALLHLAALKDEAKEVAKHGLVFGEPKIDLDKMREFKNSVVKKMTGGLVTLSKARKVNVVHGTAKFTGEKTLKIKSDTEIDLSFEHAIIAAGSRPIIPKPFQINSDRVMDSTGALELPDIPKRLLVVGGGVIGLEMGNVYASLGSNVTVIEALPQIATGADRDLIRPLEKRLKASFEAIHVNTRVESLKEKGDQIEVVYSQDGKNTTELFDRVLLSIGRRPNGDLVDAEKAGIHVDERGFIAVDHQQKTNVPHIYAIGDIVGQPMLAHKASREGHVAVEVMLGEKSVFDNLGIPSVIYTDPEVAWVGLTETEAKEKGIAYKVGKFNWAASGRATAMGRSDGITKIIFEPKTERVLGVGMTGLNAGELIAEGGLALEMGAVMEDIARTIHAHPTISETFMESAEALHGMATHIFSPKK